MSWSTDFYDSFTYGTDTADISGGMLTYYDRKFLKTVSEVLQVAPLAQKRDLPKGNGKIIQFFRYNPISVSVSGSVLTEGINPDATKITGQDLNATLTEYGGFSQHSSLLKMTHIDRNLRGITELWGHNAAATIDLMCQMELAANGSYPMRCATSTSGTHHYDGTVDSATTTTVVDAAQNGTSTGDADDGWNQSVLIMTSGTGYGQARAVYDYTQATGTFLVSPAWDVTPAAGDTFRVVSAHGLATTDILTTGYIRSALTTLRNNKAKTFGDGFYVGILNPNTEASLMADTNWVNVMQYRDLPEVKVNGLFRGEVGQWGGVRWLRTTQPFRFPIAAVDTAGTAYGVGMNNPGTSYTNYASDGAIFANFILGQEAFGVTTLKGTGGIKPGIIIKNPGGQDTSNPLNRYSTVGWVLPFVCKALNPMFAVQLWTGA